VIGEITQNKLRDEIFFYISKNKINELNKYNLYQNLTIVWGQKVKNLNDILITDDAWKVIRMIFND
jgi:predicted NAD/FAD-dependent oxidoreductase